MKVLAPEIVSPEQEPNVERIARARAQGYIYGCGIKEIEELWASDDGPVYLRPERVSERAIRRLGAFELGHRLTAFQTVKNIPIVISAKELDAFLEGFCEVLPGPYKQELPTQSEDAFVAKHDIFHNHAATIRAEHRDLVRFLEADITETLSLDAQRLAPIAWTTNLHEPTLFDYGSADDSFVKVHPRIDQETPNVLRAYV